VATPVPDLRRKTCQRCKRATDEAGPISWTGKCERCAVALAEANYLALITHSGPEFVHWRRRIAASVGGVLLDDARDAG